MSGGQDGTGRYWLLLALVFFSGYAALVYELLWFRQLGLVFGNTVQAAATVLTAFMIGLACGAYGARRWIRRAKDPVVLFGIIEAGIGLCALLVPVAFAALSGVYQGAAAHDPHRGGFLTLLRFMLVLLVLFVPTALMGASLPVLSEAALRSRERFATRLGWLYGSNTAGATLGVLACGFVLVPSLGVKATNLLAAMINIAIGAAAILLARSAKGATAIPTTTVSTEGRPAQPVLLLFLVAGFCGFLALAFETVWFRALVLVVGSTSHSFAIMVACFLLGLVIGSAALGRLAERQNRAGWALALALTGTGVWTFISLLLFQAGPELFLRSLVHFDFTYTGMLVTKGMIASVFLLPLAILSGLAFTAVVRLIRDRTTLSGEAVGAAFGVNAIGSAAGSVVGGFVLLPAFGLERSLLILGLAGMVAGLAFLWRTVEATLKARWLFLVCVVMIAAGLRLFTPAWDPLLLCSGPYFTPRTHVQGKQVMLRENLASVGLLFYREGTTATVAVTRAMNERLHFSSEGKVEADTSPQSMALQRMQGHLPMLLHPNPRRALNIGLGAGVTAGAVSCYPGVELDIADIEPAVTNVAAIWAAQNHRLIERGRFKLFVNDGRNHLLVTTNRYDVITSDPFEPVIGGAASLYTLEHFQLARSRLAPGGIMGQFLPLYELSREDVLMILRTFAKVFPRTSMFFTGTDTVLVGLTDGPEFNMARVAEKFEIPEVRASLAEIGINRAERLLDMLVMDVAPGSPLLAGDGELNTDNLPHIEYSAQKSALDYQTDTNQKLLLEHFDDFPEAYLAGLEPESVAEVKRGREALGLMLRASIQRSHADLQGTLHLLRQAFQLAPNSPIIRNELTMTLATLAGQRPDEAVALYGEALRIDPTDFWTLYSLEWLSRAQKKPELAAEYLRRGLEAHPESGMFLALRGRQRGLAGDVKAACRDLEAALKALPRRADIWHVYADFLHRDGQTALAASARSEAKRLEKLTGGS